MERQGQACTGWVHLAVEHDFYPESQGAIRGTARVTWDWVEDRICLELTFKEGLPDCVEGGEEADLGCGPPLPFCQPARLGCQLEWQDKAGLAYFRMSFPGLDPFCQPSLDTCQVYSGAVSPVALSQE